jgi:hypothetical protein
MNRHELYRPLLERTLENLQLQHLARFFDFGCQSRVAAVLVREINIRLDEVESTLGIRRVRPFELYLKCNGKDVMLPLFQSGYLEPMLNGGTFADARRLVLSTCLQSLRDAMPRADRKALLSRIDPWALVRRTGPRRYVDQLADTLVLPGEDTRDSMREMIEAVQPLPPTRRVERVDLMAPESVLISLADFVSREGGLGPVVARQLVEEVISLRNITCPRKETLKPGEIPVLATHVRARLSEETRTRFRRMAPVILTVWALGELTDDPPPLPDFLTMLKRRLTRVCFEAYRQNGLLTLMDLQWIFQLSSARISELLRSVQKEHALVVPTPGTILDAGRSLTHKGVIVNLHLAGYSVLEIAKRTFHSPRAVDSYIRTFESVLILHLFTVPLPLMARILGSGYRLVREHLELVAEHFGTAEAVRVYLREKGVKVPTIAS